MKGVLAAPRPPSAMLCYNDIVAIGATRALIESGMTPGEDMAIVGFDDIAEAQDNAPPLTTISADTKHLGARCAESLLGLIRGENPADLSYDGKTRLIIRESCGAARLERKAS
jgi:LacI family transcriptional regulator